MPAFIDFPVPTPVPKEPYCPRRIYREVKAEGEIHWNPEPYRCWKLDTWRGVLHMKLSLVTHGLPCDEMAEEFKDELLLVVERGVVIARKDVFGIATGDFILNYDKAEPPLRGLIELISRIGTHAKPPFWGERCNPLHHIEGWATGKGPAESPKYILSSVLALQGDLLLPTAAPDVKFAVGGFLNGVWLTRV